MDLAFAGGDERRALDGERVGNSWELPGPEWHRLEACCWPSVRVIRIMSAGSHRSSANLECSSGGPVGHGLQGLQGLMRLRAYLCMAGRVARSFI